MKKDFDSKTVNMVGITQILAWNYQNSLKQFLDKSSFSNVRTSQVSFHAHTMNGQLNEEDRNSQVKNVIIDLLGKTKQQ